ncbi:hypothetical protein PENTCL1PPCAC_12698, partial [Pristionchus entomophagus]
MLFLSLNSTRIRCKNKRKRAAKKLSSSIISTYPHHPIYPFRHSMDQIHRSACINPLLYLSIHLHFLSRHALMSILPLAFQHFACSM